MQDQHAGTAQSDGLALLRFSIAKQRRVDSTRIGVCGRKIAGGGDKTCNQAIRYALPLSTRVHRDSIALGRIKAPSKGRQKEAGAQLRETAELLAGSSTIVFSRHPRV